MTWFIELLLSLDYEVSWPTLTKILNWFLPWTSAKKSFEFWPRHEKKWLSFSLFPVCFSTTYLLIFDLWLQAWWQHRTLQKCDGTLVPWNFFSEFHHISCFGLVCKFGQIIDDFFSHNSRILYQIWPNLHTKGGAL